MGGENNPGSLLSILIPAFNQPEGAVDTVNYIASRIEKLGFRLEVVLSDNCSDNVSYLDELARFEEAGWLRVYRQKQNLGFSGNVAFLASQSNSQYCIVLGCGDLPQLGIIKGAIQALALENHPCEILVGGVSSHGHDRPFEELPSQTLSFELFQKFRSVWAPYQEAIPGQIYQTDLLKAAWPILPKSGNAWPHIELAVTLASSKNPAIAKFSRPFVSMHQDGVGWYYQPGLNFKNIIKHLAVLGPSLWSSGVGLAVKALALILIGLPGAIRQDLRAISAQRALNRGL